jgi:hypothetical protein
VSRYAYLKCPKCGKLYPPIPERNEGQYSLHEECVPAEKELALKLAGKLAIAERGCYRCHRRTANVCSDLSLTRSN